MSIAGIFVLGGGHGDNKGDRKKDNYSYGGYYGSKYPGYYSGYKGYNYGGCCYRDYYRNGGSGILG